MVPDPSTSPEVRLAGLLAALSDSQSRNHAYTGDLGNGPGAAITLRRERQDMIDRSETADSKLPTLAKDPTEKAESAEPTEPIESTEPTQPIDSTEPLEAMLRTESLDRIDQREPLASDTASAFPHVRLDPMGRTLVRLERPGRDPDTCERLIL